MNPKKSEIKLLTLKDLASEMSLARNAVEREMLRIEGESRGAEVSSKAIEGLAAHVKKDVSEGRLSGFSRDDVLAAKYVISYITRAAETVRQRHLTSQAQKTAQAGKVEGVKMCLELARKQAEAEARKMEIGLAQTKEQQEKDAAVLIKVQEEEAVSTKAKAETVKEAGRAKRRVGRRTRRGSNGADAR